MKNFLKKYLDIDKFSEYLQDINDALVEQVSEIHKVLIKFDRRIDKLENSKLNSLEDRVQRYIEDQHNETIREVNNLLDNYKKTILRK